MLIRALIVDDEAPARDELLYLLQAHPDVQARLAATVNEALEIMAGGDVDLVFQDIQMPGRNGFDALSEAQSLERAPLFVFVTAYDTYAIRAFEANATDYLLKPVSPERLAKCLDRVRRQLSRRAELQAKGREREEPPPQDGAAGLLNRLAVEQGGRIALIPTSHVLVIEAEEKRVAAVTDSGRMICHGLTTLARAERRLRGLPFFQANRAQLINLERIAEFSPWYAGQYTVVMSDAARTEVTVSRNRVREFKARLGI